MSYNVHNFVDGQIIHAEPINEMDQQIQRNESDIGDIIEQLGEKADLENGKVPASQLPSYVDDVLEYSSISEFPATGETGKIYVALDTNNVYRWSGSTYIQINDVLELIDDEAGIGNTEKAWSADKITKETIVKDKAGAGEIVTFENGADDLPLDKLTVRIDPIQDLHGYDKPWVGGAGKNLCYMTLAKLIEWNTDGTWEGNVYTRRGATFTVNTDSAGNVEEIVVNGTPTDTAWLRVSNEPFTLTERCKFSGLPSTGAASTFQFRLQPNTINIRDNGFTIAAGEYESLSFAVYSTYTAENLVIKPMIYRATETDTSYEPYENICPISGKTSVEVSRTGKNVFDSDVAQLTSNTNLTVEGETQSKNNRSATVGYIRLKQETNYTISYSGATNNGVFYYKADKTFISYVSWEPSGRVFTTPAETAYARFSFAESNPPSNIQVEEGSTATAYEDSAQTYSISFPTEAGAVYGGTLTVNRDGTGSLVVDEVKDIIPIDNTWTDGGSSKFYKSQIMSKRCLDGNNAYAISDMYLFEGNGNTNLADMTTNNRFYMKGYEKRILIRDDRFATLADFVTAMAGKSIEVTYKVALEESYSLTTTQVRTLLGYNVIWSDASEVAVEYTTNSSMAQIIGEINEKIDTEVNKIEEELSRKASLITPTVSGDIVTFPDGADDLPLERLIVSIAPAQDMHGYNHPWIGGAGKNLFGNGDITLTSKKYEGVTLVKPLPAGTYTVSAVVVSTDTDATTCRIGFYGSGSTEVGTAVQLNRDTRSSGTFTLTDTCVSFYFYTSDGATHGTGDSATYTDIMVETGSTATNFAPYANLCPVTGWDGVKVQRTAENLLDATKILTDGTASGRALTYLPVTVPNGTYTVSTNCGLSEQDAASVFAGTGTTFSTSADGVTNDSPRTVTVTGGVINIAVRSSVYSSYTDGIITQEDLDSRKVWICLEAGDTSNTQTYSITFPTEAGTVYGGTLTINRDGSGSLVVDMAQVDLTGKVFATTQQTSSSGRFSLSVGNNPTTMPSPLDRNAEIISSHYKGIVESEIDLTSPWVFCASDSVVVIQTADASLDTGTKLATFLTAQSNAGTPVTICYKIKSPQTYSLTANQVHTLLGYNAIWADAGQVSVTYPADTKLYIDNLNQPATGVSF